MSIKRITNPDEFNKVVDDLGYFFQDHDKKYGHQLLTHDRESFKKCFSNKSILVWNFFCWANEKEGKFDAVICFINDENPKFNKKIFSEYLWLSNNPKIGYKLLTTALKFAKENKFEYVTMSTMEKDIKTEKIKKFYKHMGFLKDYETYIAKL